MKEATSWKKKPLSQTTIGLSVSFLLPVDKDRDQRDQGGERPMVVWLSVNERSE